jgi:hypothetical protein
MGRLEDVLSKRSRNYYNDFTANINKLEAGIIFMYAAWGITHIQLLSLIYSLNEFSDIDLFVFDIDAPEFQDYSLKNNLRSDGWGETYWVKMGEIVARDKKYDINTGSGILEKLNENNRMIQNNNPSK